MLEDDSNFVSFPSLTFALKQTETAENVQNIENRSRRALSDARGETWPGSWDR